MSKIFFSYVFIASIVISPLLVGGNQLKKSLTEDNSLTTTFNGNVFISKDLSLPPSGPSNGFIKIFDNNIFHTFAHNYGSWGIDDGNTFVGIDAGNVKLTGYYDTALGYQSLIDNTTGRQNTALGALSLTKNKTGHDNTALGTYSLTNNTSASFNTAVGTSSLNNNISGSSNTAVGAYSLSTNTAGFGNTAVGTSSLNSNTGSANTAVGDSSLQFNTTGGDNTAVGQACLLNNTSGTDNTAVGLNGLGQLSSGNNNTALGVNAGIRYTSSESNNITIGNRGIAHDNNTIRIGTSETQTSCFIAGIRSTTTGNADAVTVLVDSAGQLGTINSSRRAKKDIADMLETSDRLAQLRPVTFKYKNQPANAPIEYGLIAEEVAEVFPELVVYNKEDQPETVRYHVLPTLLLNEYQQQQKRLESHDDCLDAYEQELQNLADQLEKVDTHDKKLTNQEQKIDEILQRLINLERQLKPR